MTCENDKKKWECLKIEMRRELQEKKKLQLDIQQRFPHTEKESGFCHHALPWTSSELRQFDANGEKLTHFCVGRCSRLHGEDPL